jgi:RNA polymerase sigma-70 factor (ECF subfamily)
LPSGGEGDKINGENSVTGNGTVADDPTFSDFLRRIRAGDGEAAAELVRRYEAVIRLEVRMRLSDSRLRRVFDSHDICQSAMLSFFVRAAGGQYELDRPEDLVKLLVGIARNKLAFQARKHRRQRRDIRRQEGLGERAGAVVGTDSTPSRQVEVAELIHEFRQRLSDEERTLAEKRAQGEGWDAIAAQMGGTPQARRKQLARAVNRVALELGLDEAADA